MKKSISKKVTQKSPMKALAFGMSVLLFGTSVAGVGSALATNSTAHSDGLRVKSLTPVVNKDTNEEMFVVNSTFYDYYSDSQVKGASGSTPGKIDDGKYGTDDRATDNSFVKFNNKIYDTCKYGDTSLERYPLYCGLFFGDQNADVNGNFYYKKDSSSNLKKNFWLGANSSQKGGGTLGLHADVNAATQGLIDSSLDANGNITQANGKVTLPYFNAEYLTSTKHDGTSLALGSVTKNVSFPFRTVEKDGVKTYEFDSHYDTVHLKDNGQLEYLGYNKTYNKSVQVLDQKRDDGDGTKPGFFPFNTASESDSTKLNYGFGLKLEIPFNMTSDGKINGQDIVFNFSGDDDVWVFIDGELALDIGGAHGEVSGKINFSEQYATVSGVKDNKAAFAERNVWYVTDKDIKTDVKTNFSATLKKALSDTTKSHTLTMFYMERGKIESNMKVNFNLPQPNSLTLTNVVNTDNVNPSFKDATDTQAKKDIFSYDVKDTDSSKSDSPLLKSGENTTYTDQFTTNDALNIVETGLTNEGRTLTDLYNTTWDLNDPKTQITNSKDRDDYKTTDDRTKKEDTFAFKNLDSDDYTNLVVNYQNAVLIGDLVFGKKVADESVYANEAFDFNVEFSNVFGGDSKSEAYSGDYYVTYQDGTVEKKTAKDGKIELKANEYATIKAIPVQTKYDIKETLATDSKYELTSVSKLNATYEDKEAVGTISKEENGNYFTFTNTKVAEVTPAPATLAPTAVPTAEPTAIPVVATPTVEPTAEPTVEPTVAPTEEPEEVVEPEEPNAPAPTDEPEEEVKAELPSSAPKTGDYTNVWFWVASVLVSAGAVLFTGRDLFWKKEK